MRRLVEAKAGHLIETPNLRADRQGPARVELGNSLEDVPSRLPRGAIRILVYVLPIDGRVRPDQQAKPLNHSIATGAAGIGLPHVLDDTGGLSIAEHAHANRLNVTLSAANAIECIGLGARPARKIKTSSDGLVFAVEELQQGYEFVALDQDARRVSDKQLAKALVCGVIRAIPNRKGLLRLPAKINLDLCAAIFLERLLRQRL